MKTLPLAILVLMAAMTQGCAVNVIVAPHATFVGGNQGDDVGEMNNGRVTNVLAQVASEE